MICKLTIAEDFQNAEVIFYTKDSDPAEKHLLSFSQNKAVVYDIAGTELYRYTFR